MPFFPETLSVWTLAAIFAAAAAAVWFAGTRLSGYADAISTRTGIGKAFTGMLLLGGITSLPEVAAVSTSAAVGNAPLAVNNLLGTASINLILLAVADILYGRTALTAVAATPATLMQGVLSMLLAAAVAVIATVGDVAILGVGAGSTMLALGCAAALWIASDFESRHVWEAVREDGERQARRRAADGEAAAGPPRGTGRSQWPMRKLVGATALAALVILVGGFFLSASADAIAARTGIGSSMIGFVLVGLSTSLPEISSITAAVRIRQYDMAVGDIFGTNLFNIALIFLADAVYGGEPVLSVSGAFEVVGAILPVLLTGIFLVGLLERRGRTVLRLGYDTVAALILFGGGLAVLAQMSG